MKNSFGMTLLTLVIMLGVTYISLMTTDTTKKIEVDKANVLKSTVSIEGMTGKPCEITIEKFALDVEGVVGVKASLENKNAVIEFDKTQTDIQTIMKAIYSAGYETISYEDESGVHLVTKISIKQSNSSNMPESMKCGAGKCGSN